MLVVDGAGTQRFGPLGDWLADGCRKQGLAGGVFYCTIRKSADIVAIGFQVFARGFHPEATTKTNPGEIDIPVTMAGVLVLLGNIIVGDDNGVVIIPAAVADEVLEQVADVACEEDISATILASGTTNEIFEISK